MASIDKELEEELLEVGNKLLDPPSSVDNLLHLLCQVRRCLSSVEQFPTESMYNALSPLLKALIADKLIKHSNVDVKIALASCFNEITRISAPYLPYNDPQMKEILRLIVSSFGNLHDKSNRWYAERTLILDTVARFRLCVVMVDLECDALILEMFQNFFKTVREHHPENVFSSMKTIMVLILEESEDISLDLLSLILDNLNKKNEVVLPIARKLGESVLESCPTMLKPYLRQAVNTLGISLDDYSDVLASVCLVLLEASENVTSSMKPASTKKNDSSVKEAAGEDMSKKVSERTSDSKVKPARPLAKKGLSRSSDVKITTAVDAVIKGSGKTEERTKGDGGSSSQKPEDKKRKGQVEDSSEKGLANSSSKDEDKVTVSSLKAAAKATKDEHSKETPKTNLKRKRTPGKEKGSDINKNDQSLVGKRVKVWWPWPKDNEFYKGVVDSFDSSSKKHEVSYDNGDEEVLNFDDEKWEIVEDENVTSSMKRSSSSKGSGSSKKTQTSSGSRSSKKTQTSSGSEIKGASKSSSGSDSPKIKKRKLRKVGLTAAKDVSAQQLPIIYEETGDKEVGLTTAKDQSLPLIKRMRTSKTTSSKVPRPDTTTTIDLTNSESSLIPSTNISLNLSPPSTYPEIEDFSKIIFGRVKELLDERSRITDPIESDLKWDHIRTQVDDFLVSLKESSKQQAIANQEALKEWLAALLTHIDLMDLRTNPRRHLPAPKPVIDDHIPETDELATPSASVPISSMVPSMDVVSASEFKEFKEEIRGEIASLNRTQVSMKNQLDTIQQLLMTLASKQT